MQSNFRILFLTCATRASFSVMLTTASVTALAQCWQDPGLSQLTASVARQYFPGLVPSMPRVYLCSDDQFPDPRVGGNYTTGERAMRIPLRSTSQGNLTMTLAHELGHAETERRGLFDQSVQGHGVSWMRVMIEAGLGHEAQRTAAFFAGGGQAFQLAQQATAEGTLSAGLPNAGATTQGPDGKYAHRTSRCVTRIEYLITDANGRRVEVQEFPGCAAK